LPSHSKLRDENIGVITSKSLEARRRGKVQGVKTGNGIGGAEDWDICLGIDTIGLPSRSCAAGLAAANDITVVQLVDVLLDRFAAKLPAKGQTYAARRQLQ